MIKAFFNICKKLFVFSLIEFIGYETGSGTGPLSDPRVSKIWVHSTSLSIVNIFIANNLVKVYVNLILVGYISVKGKN